MNVRLDVACNAAKLFVRRYLFLGGFSFLQDFLGFFRVLPEIRIRGFLL
jgi:hypothetical protein